ncbi:MAG: hypothetical protein IKP88_10395 [Lachnospiraceae bacterium]|nr:hypothetical protein [Lachnospiraceae bacterium]
MTVSTKEKTLIMVREIIVTQTNHWSVFGLAYGLSVMLSEVYGIGRLSLIGWGLMGIGLILNYFIRIKTDKLLLSIPLHFLVVLLMAAAALPELLFCGLHAVFALFYAVLSILKQNGGLEQEDDSYPIPVISLLICVPFFVLVITNYPEVTEMYRNLLICLFSMFFMQHYFGRYTKFVRLNERSAGFFPKSEIMGAGLKNVIIYVGISAGIFFIIANMDSLTRLWEFISGKIGYYFKQLLKKIFSNPDKTPPESTPLDYNDFDSLTTQLGQGELREQSLFGRIMEKVIIILLILLILYALYKLALKILSLLNFKIDQPGVVVDNVVTDVRESCDKASLKENKKRQFKLFLTPAEKIRREYKKTTKEKVFRICKSGDTGRLAYFTSGECGTAMNRRDMADIYDRARYSDQEITEKDAEAMKKICQEIIDS